MFSGQLHFGVKFNEVILTTNGVRMIHKFMYDFVVKVHSNPNAPRTFRNALTLLKDTEPVLQAQPDIFRSVACWGISCIVTAD